MTPFNPWLPHAQHNPRARARLFAFPHAGAGAAAFLSWRPLLPAALDLCAVELPGRASRVSEPCFEQLTALVEELARGLKEFFDLPFFFFGNSVGALVAFELTRYLRLHGQQLPLKLMVAARQAPDVPERDPLHQLSEPEFLAKLRRFEGTPAQVFEEPELMAILLPALRSDFAVNETYIYSPGPPLSCPLTVFGGRDDPTTPLEDLEAWRHHTRSVCAVRVFPGGHFFLDTAKKEVITALLADLEAPPACLASPVAVTRSDLHPI